MQQTVLVLPGQASSFGVDYTPALADRFSGEFMEVATDFCAAVRDEGVRESCSPQTMETDFLLQVQHFLTLNCQIEPPSPPEVFTLCFGAPVSQALPETEVTPSRGFHTGWRPVVLGLTSKLTPLCSMLNFDADVKQTTARHQRENLQWPGRGCAGGAPQTWAWPDSLGRQAILTLQK